MDDYSKRPAVIAARQIDRFDGSSFDRLDQIQSAFHCFCLLFSKDSVQANEGETVTFCELGFVLDALLFPIKTILNPRKAGSLFKQAGQLQHVFALTSSGRHVERLGFETLLGRNALSL